jgi:hypothetical protein
METLQMAYGTAYHGSGIAMYKVGPMLRRCSAAHYISIVDLKGTFQLFSIYCRAAKELSQYDIAADYSDHN